MKKIFCPVIDNGLGLSRTSWAMSMMVACLDVFRAHEITLRGISYPYPDGAANVAARDFLDSGCDEMILIDTDVIFTPYHLDCLLSHNEPLVFGAYPKKQLGLHLPMEWLGAENPFGCPESLVEVKRTARGFMRAKRAVFLDLIPHSSWVANFEGGGLFEFFKNLPGGHSDDFGFCDKWRKLGGKILVDQRCIAQHEGSVVYPIPGT